MSDSTKSIDKQAAKKIVQQFFDARTAGDASAVAALLTADVIWAPPKSLKAPIEGVDSVSEKLANGVAAAMLKNVERQNLHTLVDGDVVAVRQRFLSELKSGGRYDNEYVWMFYLTGEKISRIEEYTDTYHAALTLGMAERKA